MISRGSTVATLFCVGFFVFAAQSFNFVYAQSTGSCTTLTPADNQLVTCVAGNGQPVPVNSITPDVGNRVILTIDNGVVFDIGSSAIGLGSGIRVENSGRIKTSSLLSAYGISTGANNRSQAGGSTIINKFSGIIETSSTNSSGIFISATNAGSLGNTIENHGTISTSGSGAHGIRLNSGATGAGIINTIMNSGTITTTNRAASGILLRVAGAAATVTNSRTISTSGSSSHGIEILSGLGSVSIINTGIISTSGQGSFGILNSGVISSLTNSQGGNTPLTYSGRLPANYNLVVTNPTTYGKLVVSNIAGSGVMSFAIHNSPTLPSALQYDTNYSAVFSDLNIDDIENTYGTTTLGGNTYTWALARRPGSEQIDLVVQPDLPTLIAPGPSATNEEIQEFIEELQELLEDEGYALVPDDSDTRASLVSLAGTLKGLFTMQSSAIVNSMAYDCTTFDASNMCAQTAARYVRVSSNQNELTSAVLIFARRLNSRLRVNGYLDQNLSRNIPGAIATLDNARPMLGLFGVWNERTDGQGFEVKIAAGYSKKGVSFTRPEVGTSEPGSGSTSVTVQGITAVARYSFPQNSRTLLSPFAGARLMKEAMRGYNEFQSEEVAFPLSYQSIRNQTTTFIAGLNAQFRISEDLALLAGVGLERDVSLSIGKLETFGNGFFSIPLDEGYLKTRANASIGVFYSLTQNQRISVSVAYREEAFAPRSTATAQVSYTIGL